MVQVSRLHTEDITTVLLPRLRSTAGSVQMSTRLQGWQLLSSVLQHAERREMTDQEIALAIVNEAFTGDLLSTLVIEISRRTLALSRQSKRATIGTHDVTEDLKIMYDAIVGSLDWGSAFLGVEDIAAILRVGTLLGIDTPRADACPIEMNIPYPERDPKRGYSHEETQVRHAEYMTRVREAREKWAAQLQAQLDSLKEPK